jgi:hypothetical protein
MKTSLKALTCINSLFFSQKKIFFNALKCTRRIDHLGQRYYDGLINVMEYLDGLSFTVAKRKK